MKREKEIRLGCNFDLLSLKKVRTINLIVTLLSDRNNLKKKKNNRSFIKRNDSSKRTLTFDKETSKKFIHL